MAESEQNDHQLADVRADIAAFSANTSGVGLAPKDLLKYLEQQNKAAVERADREERLAKTQIEASERKELRDAQERKERHLRVASYRFAILLVALLVSAFYFADADQRKTIITLTLTSLFGVVTGATGYFFGNKDKAKKAE